MKLNLSFLISGNECLICVEMREAATADPKFHIKLVMKNFGHSIRVLWILMIYL